MNKFITLFWTTLFVLSVLYFLIAFHPRASAQAPETRTAEQGIMLARIVANEASTSLREDSISLQTQLEVHLLASVVLNYASDRRQSYSSAMRSLSPHVTGREKAESSRQEWSSSLVGCKASQPAGWVTERDGTWVQFAANWVRLCRYAVGVWLSSFEPEPDVITWSNDWQAHRVFCHRGFDHERLCLVKQNVNLYFRRRQGEDCDLVWHCRSKTWYDDEDECRQ